MRTYRRMVLMIVMATALTAAQPLGSDLQSELLNGIKAPAQEQTLVVPGKKSAATAVFYSLICPGLGEWYVDRFDQGQYSLMSEGALWLTYISFRQYGLWLREDARRFAVLHAGADIAGKNDQFFVDVSNFSNTYDYNEKKMRDKTPDRAYDLYGSSFWNWDNEVNRLEFRSQRVASERVLNNSGFVIGAIIVNHIISAVNAARLARQYNERQGSDMGSWWLESSLLNRGAVPDGLQLTLIKSW